MNSCSAVNSLLAEKIKVIIQTHQKMWPESSDFTRLEKSCTWTFISYFLPRRTDPMLPHRKNSLEKNRIGPIKADAVLQRGREVWRCFLSDNPERTTTVCLSAPSHTVPSAQSSRPILCSVKITAKRSLFQKAFSASVSLPPDAGGGQRPSQSTALCHSPHCNSGGQAGNWGEGRDRQTVRRGALHPAPSASGMWEQGCQFSQFIPRPQAAGVVSKNLPILKIIWIFDAIAAK